MSSDSDLSSPRLRYEARVQRRSAAQLQRRLVERELEELPRALHGLVASGAAEQAANAIVGARRRLLLGTGKSAAWAHLLGADLTASLSQVTVLDPSTASDVLTDVRAGDVLVAFSFRRYRRDTVEFARLFASQGGRLVVVTDTSDAPLVPVADVAVLVHTESASSADSPTAVAAAVHLVATLTTASAKGARRRLEDRETFSRALGTYLLDNPGGDPMKETR